MQDPGIAGLSASEPQRTKRWVEDNTRKKRNTKAHQTQGTILDLFRVSNGRRCRFLDVDASVERSKVLPSQLPPFPLLSISHTRRGAVTQHLLPLLSCSSTSRCMAIAQREEDSNRTAFRVPYRCLATTTACRCHGRRSATHCRQTQGSLWIGALWI